MAYCSLADLIKRIPEQEITQLTDDAGVGQTDSGVVADAISAADARIDSYLRSQYDVPLTVVPDLVKQISIDFTLFNLFTRRFQVSAGGLPETVKMRFESAQADLVRIQRGQIVLDVAGQEDAGGSQFLTDKTDDDKDFTADVWGQY